MIGPSSENGPPTCRSGPATNRTTPNALQAATPYDADRTTNRLHVVPDVAPAVSCPSWLSAERRSTGCYGGVRVFPDGGRRCYGHLRDDDLDLIQSLDLRADAIGLESRGDRMWDRHVWEGAASSDLTVRLRALEWAERLQLRRSYGVRHVCPAQLAGEATCPAEARESARDEAEACPDAWLPHAHFPEPDGRPGRPFAVVLCPALADEPSPCPDAGARHIHYEAEAPGDYWDRVACPGEYWDESPSGAYDESRCAGLRGRRVLDHVTLWEGPHGLRLAVSQPYDVNEDVAALLSEIDRDPRLHVQVLPPGQGWYDRRAWLIAVAGFVADGQTAA